MPILKLLDCLIKQSILVWSRLSSRRALINNFYARHVPQCLPLCVWCIYLCSTRDDKFLLFTYLSKCKTASQSGAPQSSSSRVKPEAQSKTKRSQEAAGWQLMADTVDCRDCKCSEIRQVVILVALWQQKQTGMGTGLASAPLRRSPCARARGNGQYACWMQKICW